MSEVKRYRATIGNGGSQRREWVYLCDDLELPQHENLFKSVSAQSVDALTAAQSELAALREELADREADVRAHAGRRIAAEQRNAALEALALLAFNSGEMTGWWCDRYAALIKPTESGASE
jgi:hypothetical protein